MTHTALLQRDDILHQENQRLGLVTCAKISSNSVRQLCEHIDAVENFLIGLLCIPFTLRHSMLAFQAKTWKECAQQATIATITGLASTVFLFSSIPILDEMKAKV